MQPEDLERISKIEWTIGRHSEEIKELSDITKHLKKALSSIEKTLAQLKWFAIGACALFIIDQFGITEIINLMR